jgi:cytochrome c oxidase cbb3-type subunit 4
MDYGTLRGFIALLILTLFIIIVIWSYSKKRKTQFDQAAHSILEDEQQENSNKKETPNV